jgi:ADP-ribose pyrophosphatase YjhB (NUDIX family)
MSKERFKLVPFVALILRKGTKILLIRRYNTGYDDGTWACAGGGVDGKEPVTNAVIREAREELGIKLKSENLKMAHVLHAQHSIGHETIGFFIEATEWEGEPKNMEPHKCDNIGWFDLNELPENLIPTFGHVVQMLEKNVFYSEFGW